MSPWHEAHITAEEPASLVLPTPAEIELEARVALKNADYIALRSLNCHMDEGVLRLSGRVPTFYMKQLASLTVMRIPGVERLDNQVIVG